MLSCICLAFRSCQLKKATTFFAVTFVKSGYIGFFAFTSVSDDDKTSVVYKATSKIFENAKK